MTTAAPPRTSVDAKISVRETISYGVGDIASNLVYAPVATFLLFYMTNVAGIAAAAAGTIVLVGQLLNGVIDVVVGALIDRTNTRWGKARPWVLLSAVPLSLFFVLLFSTPSGLSDTGKEVWIFVMFVLVMAVFFTASNVAYSALLSLITPNPKKRVTLNTVRFVCAIVTTMAVTFLMLPFVDFLGGGQGGWTRAATIFAVISALTFMVVFFGTKERVAGSASARGAKGSTRADLKSLFNNKYFYVSIALFISFYTLLGLTLGGAVYYALAVLHNGNAVGLLSMTQFVPALVGIAFMPWVIGRLGKRTAFLIGVAVIMVGALLPLLDTNSFPLLMVALVLRGVGTLPFVAGLFASVADVVDYGEWRYGRRTDGLLYSVVVVGQKVGSGLATAAIGWFLAFGRYDANAHEQSQASLNSIVGFYVYLPIALTALLGLACYLFRVERHGAEIHQALQAKRAASDEQLATGV